MPGNGSPDARQGWYRLKVEPERWKNTRRGQTFGRIFQALMREASWRGGAGDRKPEWGLRVRSGTRGLADRLQPTKNPDVPGPPRWLRSRRGERERDTGGVWGRWPPGRMAQDWAGFSEEELRRLRQSKGKGRGRWETPRRWTGQPQWDCLEEEEAPGLRGPGS